MEHLRRAVIETGLTAEQRELFKNNAWFRQGVEQLVLMIPVFLDGLEVQAEAKNAEMQNAMAAIMAAPPLSLP